MNKYYETNSVFNTSRESVYEYLLVVSPPEAVHESVMEIKQSFSGKYNQPDAVKSKPHITIANFLAMERMEDTLIRWMQRAVYEQESFTAQLNNYSGFPAHTIFLRVQDADPFKELSKRLKVIASYIKEYKCSRPMFITNPHMSIAGSLQKEVYEKALQEYARKEFVATFNVQQLLLLRKHYENKFESYKKVALLNLKQQLHTN